MEFAEKGTVLDNLRNCYEELSVSERKIAEYILQNPNKAVNCNVSELANASGTSDATIIRFCKHLGYSGYYQLRIMLSRELGRIDQEQNQENGKNTAAGALMKYAANLMSIARRMDEKTVQSCAELIRNCSFVHIVAAGNTTPLAQYLGFRLERLGIRATYHTVIEYCLNDVALAQGNDVVLAISQSGSSKEVVKALELAVERKIRTIAVVGYEYSPVSKLADYLVPAVLPEQGFDYRKNHAHLYEMAVIDALLESIANGQEKKDAGIVQEMLMADTKL